MVHHTEWDRKFDDNFGYMLKDREEMKDIIREMAPGGKHYHPEPSASPLPVTPHATSNDNPLPSLYHGKWYAPRSHLSALRLGGYIMIVLLILALIFTSKHACKGKSRGGKNKSRSRTK